MRARAEGNGSAFQAEQGAGADALQRTLAPRSRFRRRLTAGVRPHKGVKHLKVHAQCAVCFGGEFANSKPGHPPRFVSLPGDLHDTGVLFITCPEGHQSATMLNHRKHEILFASGMSALIDGYTNEAVASFAAALERAYEFYIHVVSRRRGVSQAVFEAAWKLVVHQSERQLGAFCFLYLLETGSPFKLSDKMAAFRNKVIHRGYIPALSEAYEYAGHVFESVQALMGQLYETSADVIQEVMSVQYRLQMKAIPPGMRTSSMAFIYMDGLFQDDKKTFQQWVQEFSTRLSILKMDFNVSTSD